MLKINRINRRLGNFALTDVNLQLSEGDYYVLLGRSGSGKTQLLETIAGMGRPESGSIILDGRDITRTAIQERNVGIVFQDFAIFPHLTVFGNIAYPLKSLRIDKKDLRSRVETIAEEFNISSILHRKPQNLSGGELQRVALARTLVKAPRLLLLDEPLASIDASLKDDIRRLLRRLNREGQTIIHVTHDYTEALSLANRVGVIHNGKIIQEGDPSEVFENPVNKFVARYAGNRNFFRIEFERKGDGWHGKTRRGTNFLLDGGSFPASGLIMVKEGKIVLSIEQQNDKIVNSFKGKVIDILPTGHGIEVAVEAKDIFYVDLYDNTDHYKSFREGDEVWVCIPAEALKIIPD